MPREGPEHTRRPGRGGLLRRLLRYCGVGRGDGDGPSGHATRRRLGPRTPASAARVSRPAVMAATHASSRFDAERIEALRWGLGWALGWGLGFFSLATGKRGPVPQ